jgi:hypothetical protein
MRPSALADMEGIDLLLRQPLRKLLIAEAECSGFG